MITLCGIPASPGIAIGPVFRFERADLRIEAGSGREPAVEMARAEAALATARQDLEAIAARVRDEGRPEQAGILEAQAMMLEDPELMAAIRSAVEGERASAEAAIYTAAEFYAGVLEALTDETLRARAADVRDAAGRALRLLMNAAESPLAGLTTPSIVLAAELAPSDTALLDRALVLGFCTVAGGATSHTAILARGLGLPAVVGAGRELLALSAPTGSSAILDGGQGLLLIDPDAETVAAYRSQQAAAAARRALARSEAQAPAVTQDGRRVEVAANIGSIDEVDGALEAGAEGIGLLRTEFLFLGREDLPSEEEQYRAYRAIAERMAGRSVVLRTLDIGGDKDLPTLHLPAEPNPFLGLRAIRLCLTRPDLFRPQLRAVLRGGVGNNLKVMFPMVATVGELRAARAILEECRAELLAEGRPAAAGIEIGIMVEVPAAALVADQLAREVDFFSIGTNDLSQYTLAADRTNSQVAPLASGFQPAVLRLVQNVIAAAHQQGKWVGLCGELAGEPLAIPILLGLGLDEFSMSPPAIPAAKQAIRSLALGRARQIAETALTLESAEAVQQFVRESVLRP